MTWASAASQEVLLIGLVLHEASVELYKQLGFLTFLENYTRVSQGPRALRLAWLFESCTATLPPVPSPIPLPFVVRLSWQSYMEAQGLENKGDGVSQDGIGLPQFISHSTLHFLFPISPSGISRTSGKSRLMWERPEHGYDCPWRKSYFPDT